MPDETCKNFELLWTRNIAFAVAYGLELGHPKELIIKRIEEQDKFWREQIVAFKCPETDVVKGIGTVVENFKGIIRELL